MRLYAVLPAVIALLQREGRVTYRALQRDFDFDVSLLDDVRHELVFKRLAMDEQGQGLVWTGGVYMPTPLSTPSVPKPSVQVSPAVSALPPMELGSNPSPAAWSTASDAVAMPPRVVPTEVTSPEQTASAPAPMALDGPAPGASPSPTTEAESTLANATEMRSSSNRAAPAVPSTRSAPEAERRQLTVMFCDLADSTKLSQELDPEDLREVIRAYQQTSAEVIQRFDGYVAQHLGDGLLIYFGWPRAHEDDAQRAVHTGLGIVDAMERLNARLDVDYGVELAVRIGIHTGPVVVGAMGGGERHENLALGETPNIAARLEGLAEPKTAVISPVTARLVQRSFVLEALGPHDLKGVAKPMMLYAVVSPREVGHDDDGTMTGGFDALVGRDEEIGLLLRRWEQSQEGLGHVVMLSGEAGIGKSSLVEGLRDYVRQAGFTRIAFRCSPYHTHSAFYPIIAHVQRALGWQPEDPIETRLAKLEHGLEGTSLPLEEAVPLMASLLSLPLPDGRYPTLSLSPQQQRQQTHDVIVVWLLEEAARQPVLAVWEDLHWADPSTLETLSQLVEQAPTAAMLHVLTFRPEFEPPWPSRSHLTPITLHRLERPQVEALVKRLTCGKRLPEEVVAHIVGKTDGVPLYVEELTKMLLASDLLGEEAEQYVLTGPLLSVAIPDTLQDSLMARLDQMNTAKEVAQLGSVLGREFAYDMLQALASQDEEILQSALALLVQAELLYRRGRPPRARYIFKHALIQDAAYASLLRSTRQQVHQQVAQLLEAHFPETVETEPELVAHHYTEADLPGQAVSYWQQAGRFAQGRSAHDEAIAHLSQGLHVLAALPESLERDQQELTLHLDLGKSLSATKGWASPETEAAYTRAWKLCQQTSDTSWPFTVLWGLSNVYVVRADLTKHREVGAQLLSFAGQRSDAILHLVAHYLTGQNLLHVGEYVTSLEHFNQACSLYDPQYHHTYVTRFGVDVGVFALSYMSHALWGLGYPQQAVQRSREALALAEEVQHPFSTALAQAYAAMLHQFRREPPTANTHAEIALAVCTEQGFAYYMAWATIMQGWALAETGQRRAGIAQMHQGLTALQDTGGGLRMPYYLALLAKVEGELGQAEKGIRLLLEASGHLDKTQDRWVEAELYRLRGDLLLAVSPDNHRAAETCFHQALEVAQSQQAKSWELRAATSLARLWQSLGKRQEAYDLLAPVYEWFTEGFDMADLQEAKALLAELST